MGQPLKTMYVTSPFGWREHPIYHDIRHHDGVDLRAYFVPVLSPFAGVIYKTLELGAYGKQVFITHEDGSMSHCAHLSQILVVKNQQVEEGQQIAVSGNTGTLTTAPHLHFGIKIDGRWVNPMDILVKGTYKKATPEKYTIGGVEYEGLLIDGILWVKGRESHEAVGNQVNWTPDSTEIIPIPKMKLKLIKDLL